LKIGIEQEFIFKDDDNNYLDFSNTSYNDFQIVVDNFPAYRSDNSILECKSLESVPKRCYVEGFERYDNNGKLLETIPKALEIRTPPFENINKLINNFASSYNKMIKIASSFGLFPILTSFNPFKNNNNVEELLKHQNINGRSERDLEIAKNSFLSNGLHVNISDKENINLQDIAEKLNFYLPYNTLWLFITIL